MKKNSKQLGKIDKIVATYIRNDNGLTNKDEIDRLRQLLLPQGSFHNSKVDYFKDKIRRFREAQET